MKRDNLIGHRLFYIFYVVVVCGWMGASASGETLWFLSNNKEENALLSHILSLDVERELSMSETFVYLEINPTRLAMTASDRGVLQYTAMLKNGSFVVLSFNPHERTLYHIGIWKLHENSETEVSPIEGKYLLHPISWSRGEGVRIRLEKRFKDSLGYENYFRDDGTPIPQPAKGRP